VGSSQLIQDSKKNNKDMITVKIESSTLNGEISFESHKELMPFLKALQKDAYNKSKPELIKTKWNKHYVSTTNHFLKITILNNEKN
jgi:hypothetical protein